MAETVVLSESREKGNTELSPSRALVGEKSLCASVHPVDGYVAHHELDSGAARLMRALTPAGQMQVMQTDVSAARNVSAVVATLCQKVGGTGFTGGAGSKRQRIDYTSSHF